VRLGRARIVAMGAWGTAVFSDDLACDIRDGWRDLLSKGVTPDDAAQRILVDYAASASDPDERAVFWIALAVSQWKTGRLQPAVLDEALAAIDSGDDLERWLDPADRRKRQAVLERTRDQLLSPQPPAKRIPRRVLSETPFQEGDVIAYRHPSGYSFVLWVSANGGDKGGAYSQVELLDFVGTTVPSLKVLTRLPAMLHHYERALDGSQHPPDRAGFLLVHASRLSPERYAVVGNRPWKNRPRHQLLVVTPADLDHHLDGYVPGRGRIS